MTEAALPRVLVIQHEDAAPPGMLEAWLGDAGVACDVLEAHHGRALPAALGEHAGLVVLGGAMNAYEDGAYRWLLPTKALIATTIAGGLPYLGVCLGHQLAAVALGGEVTPNPAGRTHGLQPWAPTEAGREDPVLGGLPGGTAVLHWNSDVVVRLPDTAVALGHAPDGTLQAARLGPRAWSVQFHPEVTTEIVSGWDDGPDREADELAVAELDRHLPELHEPWSTIGRRFARVVRGD